MDELKNMFVCLNNCKKIFNINNYQSHEHGTLDLDNYYQEVSKISENEKIQ